jgi:hypothetical protein
MAVVAVASGGYSAYQAREQRKEAEQEADKQRADNERARNAQEMLAKSRKDNLKYSKPADVELGTDGNMDGTTSFNGIDAFRINPAPSAPSALNIPGGQA